MDKRTRKKMFLDPAAVAESSEQQHLCKRSSKSRRFLHGSNKPSTAHREVHSFCMENNFPYSFLFSVFNDTHAHINNKRQKAAATARFPLLLSRWSCMTVDSGTVSGGKEREMSVDIHICRICSPS